MKEGERPPLNRRLAPFGTSVFTEMTRLAIEHRAVNLGQGFPDFDGPEFVKEAAIAAIRAGENQYSRSFGVPELNRAVAEHRRRFYGLEYDPDREVSVFAGATEAIFSSIQALCEPGDEVIVFDPAYDSYRPSIALAGRASPPALRAAPRGARSGRYSPHASRRDQHTAQPDRQGLHARRAGVDRRAVPRKEADCGDRRGL